MLFGEKQFEKPKIGDEAGPEEEKPAEGQPGEEAAGQPGAPEGAAEEGAEKKEQTGKDIEKRYQERTDKLRGVMIELSSRYSIDVNRIMTVMREEDGAYSLDRAKLGPELASIIDKAREKNKEIGEERRAALEALEAKKIVDFGSKIEGI